MIWEWFAVFFSRQSSFVLYACLKSETDDFGRARIKVLDMRPEKRKDNLELLLMAQVLASPSKSRIGVGKGLYVLFLLVPVLHFFVVKSDIQSYDVAKVLEDQPWPKIETIADGVAFLFVVVSTGFCIYQQRKIESRTG